MKRPAFQFYPADWRKDVALQACSLAAQGLWVNVLCLAHECSPYGHLALNGKPMTTAQIAKGCGTTPKECEQLLQELDDAGVSSRNDEGFLFSRRMVRDEHLRNVRAESGRLGGNPKLLGRKVNQTDNQDANQADNQDAEQKLTPSSSSSSSSSSKNTRSNAPPDGFAEFWSAYPKKVGKPSAEKAWKRLGHVNGLLPTILQALDEQRESENWTKAGGQYIPHPATWINDHRWEAGSESASKPWETH